MCKTDKCNKKLLVGRKKQELAFFDDKKYIFNITKAKKLPTEKSFSTDSNFP